MSGFRLALAVASEAAVLVALMLGVPALLWIAAVALDLDVAR